MNPIVVNQFFDAHPQFHRQSWLDLAKPCVDIHFVDGEITANDSYFGGVGFFPKGFEYPTHPDGYYRFLGQLNFSDIDDPSNQLPKSGVLSLFFADDPNGEMFWGNDGYVLGYFWHNTDDFVMMDMPKDIAKDWEVIPNPKAKKVQFAQGIELPMSSYFEMDYPPDYDQCMDKWYDIDELDSCNHLLGYPQNDTLGYDPTPKGFIPLLTLKSEGALHWCWHDGDSLMIFINPDKLKQRDFSDLKTDAG